MYLQLSPITELIYWAGPANGTPEDSSASHTTVNFDTKHSNNPTRCYTTIHFITIAIEYFLLDKNWSYSQRARCDWQ